MTSQFNWNDSQVQKNFNRLIREFSSAENTSPIGKGVLIASQALLSDAQDIVPFRKGFLEQSGRTSAPKRFGRTIESTVGFNTPYAVKVHEDLTLNISQRKASKSGKMRQQKYLESPFKENAEKYTGMIEQIIVKYLR